MVTHPLNKFPAFFEMRTFITVFIEVATGPCPKPKYDNFVTLRKVVILYGEGVLSPPLNPKAGEPPVVSCPQSFIDNIGSYPPHLEAVSSARNLRTNHFVGTKSLLNENKRRN
jgi:hypothetical protein